MGTGQLATIPPPEVLNQGPGLPTAHLEPRWYAAYTCANHEKRVAEQLRERCIEYFLPLYECVRRWKDRRVNLQTPLFPGYIFVRVALRDRLCVLQTPGVVLLVSFAGQPAPLSQEEILAIRNCLSYRLAVEPHPYLRAGRRVQVKNGPLQGLEGIVVRRKNRSRFVLSFELLQRSVAIEINVMDLQPAK
jgi:transcription antitermination factor NusG